MIFGFRAESSHDLDLFLDKFENPESFSRMIAKLSFLEFKVHRFDDVVIVSQMHLYDVVAKWLVLGAFANLLFAYLFKHPVFFYLCFIFLTVGIMWLSKWVRFYAMKFSLRRFGYKGKIDPLSNEALINLLLLRYSDGSK